MTMPEGLEKGIKDNLLIFRALKQKFRKKFNNIPFDIRKIYNYDELDNLLQSCKAKKTPELYLSKVYTLGFLKNKEPYLWVDNTLIDEFQMAEDYVGLLYNFDDIVHDTISKVLKVPEDLTDYMLNKHHWDNCKMQPGKSELKPYYKYIHYLSE